MKSLLYFATFCLTLQTMIEANYYEINSEIVGVFIIGRHGDRTPEAYQMATYPSNPHINETFFPFGLGALTNEGKKRAYVQGKYFRARYGNFLSDLYLPQEIKVKSTTSERAVATALITLASLYKPFGVQQWDEFLEWQPVPVWTADQYDAELMFQSCNRWLVHMKKILSQDLSDYSKYETLHAIIANNTAAGSFSANSIINIFDVLVGQESFGIPWPEWATLIRDEIEKEMDYVWKNLLDEQYDVRLSSGVLLHNILRDSAELIRGNKDIPKFQYFSAHDMHVSSMLKACKLELKGRPGYVSSLALELRRNIYSGIHGFQFIYIQEMDTYEPEKLISEGCENNDICEFRVFQDLVLSNIVDEYTYREACL